MSNILAIVGRPNVGKSTFFNRLTRSREAIVDPTAGVTRDRHYGTSDWNGIEFSVIDTGGFVYGGEDTFEEEIRKQVMLAIEEADVITFLVDISEGLTPMDEDVIGILRQSGKKTFMVVNKCDNNQLSYGSGEFYGTGLGDVYTISALNGAGTGDLLDEIVKEFKNKTIEDLPDIPRVAVVGRPNVGKSSLVNAITGAERSIVTPIAGTTRDSIFTRYKGFGLDMFLVDTAGLRKKARVNENIEFYSVMRSVRAIENSNVCILMIDATEGFESQDMNILHLMLKNHKGTVLVVNKWDLVEKDSNSARRFEQFIKGKTAPFTDYPVIFTSVTEKQRILKTLETAVEVYNNCTRKIPTSQLNEYILPLIQATPPPIYRGRTVKIKYGTQLPTQFPAFAFFCNHPKHVRDPYKRFIENKLREQYNFSGAPMEIFFREK